MGDEIFGSTGGKFRRQFREFGPILGAQRKERRISAEKSKKAEERIAGQTAKEARRLQVESAEVKKREATAAKSRGGRSSLIATTQTGLATNLGGTTNG